MNELTYFYSCIFGRRYSEENGKRYRVVFLTTVMPLGNAGGGGASCLFRL